MSVNEIVSLVLKIVCFLLVSFVIPLLKKKYDQSQIDAVLDKIQTYVEAADQIFGKDEGAEKKQWVRGRLAAHGIDVDLDLIDAEIEACVLMLHNALKE
ncbi:MAG: hypothetical protein J6Y78_16065 [Paludibacteraceae bacterium]|nr:hypothetical protein [Paludibacteraceae bacterium]